MSGFGMTLNRAQDIVVRVAEARKRWGKQAVSPVTEPELLEALMVVHENAKLDATPAEEVTKLRRQLAACQNREKARTTAKGTQEALDIQLPNGAQLELPLE